MRKRIKRKKNKFIKIIISVAAIIAVFSLILIMFSSLYSKHKIVDNAKVKVHSNPNAKTSPAPVNVPESIKTSYVLIDCAGDCTLGYDDKFSFANSLPYVLKKQGGNYSYFFKNVSSIFSSDDITTANLETTLTNADSKAQKEFTFKADPEYAKALTLGSIEAVNISNNHIYDYGTQGFSDTVTTLNKNNIGYFGEGNKCIKEVKDVKFGFLGYRGFYYDNASLKKIKDDINDLKSKGCTVIINFHWGEENSYHPNDTQKYLAHYAIDNGADLIIGHHPHVIQGIESYKDRFICYSLGNFCFGGNTNPYDKDTFIFQDRLKFQDDKLISQEIRAIPCSISSVDYINDYCPTPMDGVKKDALLKKLNGLSKNADFTISDKFTNFDVK
jgi:hypothetical protein